VVNGRDLGRGGVGEPNLPDKPSQTVTGGTSRRGNKADEVSLFLKSNSISVGGEGNS
jgi:hypothetical protein